MWGDEIENTHGMEWNGMSLVVVGIIEGHGVKGVGGYHKGNIYIRNLQERYRNIAATECWMGWDLKGNSP